MARNTKRGTKRSRDIGKTVTDRIKDSRGASLFAGKFKQFSPAEDTYKFIILPFEAKKDNAEVKKGDLYYRLKYLRHNNIGPEGNEKKYNCPSSFGLDCPICEDMAQLREDYSKNEVLIAKYQKKYRELYALALLEDVQKALKGRADWEEIIQVMEISWHGFGKLLETRIDNGEAEEELGKFANYGKGGRILKVVFSEYDFINTKPSKKKGKSNPPVQATIIDFLPRNFELDEEELLQHVPQLDELLVIPEYDALRRAYFELDNDNDEEDEEEEEEKKSRFPNKKVEEPESEEETKEEEEENDNDSPSDEFDDIDRSELKKYIKKNELNIKVFKTDEDNEIRDKIREALSEEEEEEPDEEESEEEDDDNEEEPPFEPDPPKKKSSRRGASVKTDKKEDKKSSKKSNKESKKGKCPDGHNPFGKFCGDYESCDDCNLFDECMEKRAEME